MGVLAKLKILIAFYVSLLVKSVHYLIQIAHLVSKVTLYSVKTLVLLNVLRVMLAYKACNFKIFLLLKFNNIYFFFK